jgi:hypothetical protein
MHGRPAGRDAVVDLDRGDVTDTGAECRYNRYEPFGER